jgi:hypothetical protein
MKRFSTTATALPPTTLGAVGKAWEEVSASFDHFCLAAGIEALGTMLENDAQEACGPRHSRAEGRRGYRWGRTQGKIGFHGGRVEIERPRVRELGGREVVLPSWERAITENWLGRWAPASSRNRGRLPLGISIHRRPGRQPVRHLPRL